MQKCLFIALRSARVSKNINRSKDTQGRFLLSLKASKVILKFDFYGFY